MISLLAQILPLAHHNTVAALPVFAPALVVCIVLLVHFIRARRHWDDEEASDAAQPDALDPARPEPI
jgi:hypothetical protein